MKKIFKNYSLIIFAIYILLHSALLSINTAEWGDSYRILRASEYIREFTYPSDEKRPPLFSALLAIRPSFVDQILWGRIMMFGISIAAFIVFKKLIDLFIKDEKYKNIALLFFALNPVYFYWALRIYADVPFSLLVMLAFLFFYKKNFILSGVIVGLSVLTRFEGYLLLSSLGLAMVIHFILPKTDEMRDDIGNLIKYIMGFSIFIVPYLLWRNPLTSSYFEEPSGRTHDVKMFMTYIISLIYLFGITSPLFFVFFDIRRVGQWMKDHLPVAIFLLLELALILFWPAAVPRLFVSVIPFLIIIMVGSIQTYFESGKKIGFTPLLGLTTLIVLYAVSQYFLKLQFLILSKPLFAVVIFLQLVILYFLYIKNLKYFLVLSAISMLIWTLSTVWLHKDNFKAIKNGAEYVSENLSGVVGYNDVSSVSDWYLNEKKNNSNIRGVFFPYSKKADLNLDNLTELGFDYLLMTNEHNTDMTLDISSRPYLKEIRSFDYVIGGKIFFAKVLQIMPE